MRTRRAANALRERAGGATAVFCLLLPSDLKNPEIVTLRNLTKDSAGVYKCTASNDVGEESCTVEVKLHCEWKRFLRLCPKPERPPGPQLWFHICRLCCRCERNGRDGRRDGRGLLWSSSHHPHHLAGVPQKREAEVRGRGDPEWDQVAQRGCTCNSKLLLPWWRGWSSLLPNASSWFRFGVVFFYLFSVYCLGLVPGMNAAYCALFREDAEAPKAKLMKPNSLSSSRSGSSRSGTSSTQSMMHHMGPRGQPVCIPAVAALKHNCQGYVQTVPKTPERRSTPTSTSTTNSKTSSPPKLSPGNLTRMGATPVMIPAQTKAFQTV